MKDGKPNYAREPEGRRAASAGRKPAGAVGRQRGFVERATAMGHSGHGADSVRAVDSDLATALILTSLGRDTVRLERVHATDRVQLGTGGGKDLAKAVDTEFLGEIPIDGRVRHGGDAGVPIVVGVPDGEHAKIFMKLAERVAGRIVSHVLSGPRRSASLVAIK